MPIETERLDHGLYLNRWQGDITLDEIRASEARGAGLMQQHGEAKVVLINDLTDIRKVPLDLKALRRVVENNPQVIALLIVNAPSMLQMYGQAQAQTVPWIIDFFDTIDAAVSRGRDLLSI